jgi:hypothetical protein
MHCGFIQEQRATLKEKEKLVICHETLISSQATVHLKVNQLHTVKIRGRHYGK